MSTNIRSIQRFSCTLRTSRQDLLSTTPRARMNRAAYVYSHYAFGAGGEKKGLAPRALPFGCIILSVLLPGPALQWSCHSRVSLAFCIFFIFRLALIVSGLLPLLSDRTAGSSRQQGKSHEFVYISQIFIVDSSSNPPTSTLFDVPGSPHGLFAVCVSTNLANSDAARQLGHIGSPIV